MADEETARWHECIRKTIAKHEDLISQEAVTRKGYHCKCQDCKKMQNSKKNVSY